MSSKLVFGVGFNDRKYPAKVNGKNTKEYHLWQNLLARCYYPKFQTRQPTYVGCSVSKNFRSYSYFHQWCQSQIGFGKKGFDLDKDLLLRGNKLYSEDTCLFLPRELNSLLLSCKAVRGNLPLGVTSHQGKFLAQCHREAAAYYLGMFDTPEEAHNAYKQAKETFIKSQAEKWKDQIDIRAYEALMSYEISITD